MSHTPYDFFMMPCCCKFTGVLCPMHDAAPDLLSALEALVPFAKVKPADYHILDPQCLAVQQAHAAIARAKEG